MMLDIYLSEEKAKENDIDINECYDKIDNYFIKKGVHKMF